MEFNGGLLNSGLFNNGLFNNNNDDGIVVPPSIPKFELQVTGNSFGFIIQSGINPLITVDWGDGNTETFNTLDSHEHNYSAYGIYTVKLSGSFDSGGHLQLNHYAHKNKLYDVSKLPFINGLVSCSSMFENCENLQKIPTDLFRNNPQLNNFVACFSNCVALNGTNVPADLFRYLQYDASFGSVFSNVAFSTQSYSDLLISMNANMAQNYAYFDGGNSKYNASAVVSRLNLTTVKGWTVIDGGLEV